MIYDSYRAKSQCGCEKKCPYELYFADSYAGIVYRGGQRILEAFQREGGEG
jgi:hypothetical protein